LASLSKLTLWDVVALETPTNTCHYCLSVVCAVEIRRPWKGAYLHSW
jgi:hypothetical protein